MKHLIEQLMQKETSFDYLDLVIHVGAGKCKELSLYRKLRPTSLCLVEANPTYANELLSRVSSENGERVVNSIVSVRQANETTLFLCNHFNEHSIFQLSGLLEFLPNLSIVSEVLVKNERLSTVLLRNNFNVSNKNLLVIETPGCELDVLTSVNVEELLGFKWIALRIGRLILHEGGASFSSVNEFLSKRGFVCKYHSSEAIEPYLEVAFCRDENLVHSLRVEGELQASEQKCREYELELKAYKELQRNHAQLKLELQQLEVLQKSDSKALVELNAQTSIFKNQLDKIRNEYDQQNLVVSQLTLQLDSVKDQLANERSFTEHVRKESHSLKMQLDQLRQKNADDLAALAASVQNAEKVAENERSLKEKFRTDSIEFRRELEQLKIENAQLHLQYKQQIERTNNLEQSLASLNLEREQNNASLLKAEVQIASIFSLLTDSQ